MTTSTFELPASVRLARAVAGAQSIIALLVAVCAVPYALTGYHSWRHPRPDSFDGLTFGLAVGVLVPATVVLLTVGVPTLLLRRPRRAAAGVLVGGQGLILLTMLQMESTYTLLSPSHAVPTVIWLAVVGSAVTIITCLMKRPSLQWLDGRLHG